MELAEKDALEWLDPTAHHLPKVRKLARSLVSARAFWLVIPDPVGIKPPKRIVEATMQPLSRGNVYARLAHVPR